jgi:hypothetical protein
MQPSPCMSSPIDLVKICTDQYWHKRHIDCTIDSPCRLQCVLLAVADAVVPAEDEPGADATLVAYTTWAERMRIRRLLLNNVH